MRARSTPAVLAVVIVLSTLVAARSARAQWTLPQGQGVVGLGYSYEFANSEWLGRHLTSGTVAGTSTTLDHSERPFPLEGSYQASAVNLAARYGITDQFELELDVPVRFINYQSDSINFGAGDLQFARQAVGLGDIQAAARYRWLASPIAMATEVRGSVPTGYTGPTGTFGPNQNLTLADVRPDNVHDDVTLGDAQLAVSVSQLFGLALPTRTFMRLGLGYMFRFGGGADELLGDFRIGQAIGSQVLIYAGVSGEYAIERDVRPIGVSVLAVDPIAAASAYTLANLVPQLVYTERDAIDVGGGVIFKLTDSVEVNVGVTRTVVGINTAAATQVGISIAVRSQWYSPPPPPEPAAVVTNAEVAPPPPPPAPEETTTPPPTEPAPSN